MDKEREAGMDMTPDKDEIIIAQQHLIREMNEVIKAQSEEIIRLHKQVKLLEKQLADASWKAEQDRYYYESQPKETW